MKNYKPAIIIFLLAFFVFAKSISFAADVTIHAIPQSPLPNSVGPININQDNNETQLLQIDAGADSKNINYNFLMHNMQLTSPHEKAMLSNLSQEAQDQYYMIRAEYMRIGGLIRALFSGSGAPLAISGTQIGQCGQRADLLTYCLDKFIKERGFSYWSVFKVFAPSAWAAGGGGHNAVALLPAGSFNIVPSTTAPRGGLTVDEPGMPLNNRLPIESSVEIDGKKQRANIIFSDGIIFDLGAGLFSPTISMNFEVRALFNDFLYSNSVNYTGYESTTAGKVPSMELASKIKIAVHPQVIQNMVGNINQYQNLSPGP